MKISLIVLISVIAMSLTYDKPTYVLYNNSGEPVNYQKMIMELQSADIVLFGELHDNPISHWLELEVTKDLFKNKKQNLVLSAEMFETDNQEGVNNYLKNDIDDKEFKKDVRLWPNYKTDYKPLLDFAKINSLVFVAANIPRRYASMVFKGGYASLDTLPKEEKQWIAPLPIKYEADLECYKAMMEMKMRGMKPNENFPKAQASKDATMAHFILKNWKEGKLLIHYQGAYHSDNHEGVEWHLKNQNKDLKILTISTVLQKDVSKLEKENLEKANYIICVPESMTRTY